MAAAVARCADPRVPFGRGKESAVASTAARLYMTAPECANETPHDALEIARHRMRRRLRIAVLDPHPFSRLRLATMATSAGLEVGVAAAPGDDAVALVVDTRCDAVLLAATEPASLSGGLGAQLDCAVVVCSENTSTEMVRAADGFGAMGFLLKPVQAAQLAPALVIAVARFADTRSLRCALEERKVIERAKGRLMSLHGATEEAAFRWLRRRAMNTRRRMADVARDILGRSTESQTVR
jgi:response regulator NasT